MGLKRVVWPKGIKGNLVLMVDGFFYSKVKIPTVVYELIMVVYVVHGVRGFSFSVERERERERERGFLVLTNYISYDT